MAKKRLGRQEPTQSVYLPCGKSLYREAVELYQKTGRQAQRWQQLLLKEIMKQTKGLWRHTKFGYSVPRRNGKNEVVAMRELWGLENGERILHTAHRTTTSHTAWDRLCSLLDASGTPYTSLKAAGRERIELAGGGVAEFRTRSTKGGLGEGFDLLVIDEAQEYTEDQESALKYVVSDADNPQTIFCGTPPTPLSSGTVFLSLRRDALNGDTQNTGWAEWSVDELSDVRDRDLWYECNPSMGSILTERKVADEIGSDEVDFNIQRLGLWLKYNQKSAISENEWKELIIEGAPSLQGKLFVGIKYGNDGANVALSIAAKMTDGRIFTEVIDCRSIRNGNDWIVDFLRRASVQAVAVDGANGQRLLESDIKDARVKPAPILPTVKEIIVANSAFEQAVFKQTLCHKDQPSLTQVVVNSEKRPIGSNGGFGYRSQLEENDVALMDSVILAHWICSESKDPVKQKIRY